MAVRIFAGVVPFVALALLAHAFHRRGVDWRASIMTATVSWGVAVAVITEGLSLFGLLSFAWVLAAWLVLVALLGIAHRALPSAVSAGPARRWPDRWSLVALAGLIPISIPWIVENESRPLLGRDSVFVSPRVDQYFKNRGDLRVSYLAAVQRVRDARCSRVGLWIAENPEYPLWVLLTPDGGAARPRIDHLWVHNESRRLPSPLGDPSDPCAILVTFELSGTPETLSYRGFQYGLNFRSPPVSLFLR